MALVATHNEQNFRIGDLVRVHQRIQEDNKTRTQVFEGTVIAIQGTGVNKSFVVRRIGAAGVAIERIFPIFSPFVERVEVRAEGHVRRSKLYYIREKTVREIADLTKRKQHQGHSVKKVATSTKKASKKK